MRKTFLLSVLIVPLAIVATTVREGRAVLLDFDALTPGDFVTTEFADQGVVFSHGSFFEVRDNSAGGAILKPSPPNQISITDYVLGPGNITFVDPTNSAIPATTDHFQFDNPGLLAVSGAFYAGLVVAAYGVNDELLGFAVVDPIGPNQARPIFTTEFNFSGIHRVQFQRIENPHAPAFVGIDNVSFNPVTPVPEPSSILLAIVGLVGVVTWGRRSRQEAEQLLVNKSC